MTATRSPDRLYELLPGGLPRAGRRRRRSAAGPAARSSPSQVDVVEQDIAQLWDDLFIETCDDWVIPYIGDLVSNNLLLRPQPDRRAGHRAGAVHRSARPATCGRASPSATRADVAKTIYYRRRKGTLPMLEELARDVTGWAAHAVEFFELLGWTQHLEHIRPQACWLRRALARARRARRTARSTRRATASTCARSPSTRAGTRSRTSASSSGACGSYPLLDVPARPAGAAVGAFTSARSATPRRCSPACAARATRPASSTELHVPGADPPRVLQADLDRHRGAPPPDFTDLYGTIDELGAPPAANPDASLVRDCATASPSRRPQVRLRAPGPVAGGPADRRGDRDRRGGRPDRRRRRVPGPGDGRRRLPLRLPGRHRRRALTSGATGSIARDPALQRYEVRAASARRRRPSPRSPRRWRTGRRSGAPARSSRSSTAARYALPASITLADTDRLAIEAGNRASGRC